MTTSNLINPLTGHPYKVGDVLATREQAIAFAEAVGWEFAYYVTDMKLLISGRSAPAFYNGAFTSLPYTIKALRPEHTATVTPNPPLTFAEAMELPELWLVAPPRILLRGTFLEREYNNGNKWDEENFTLISACIAHGKVYAHDPTEFPPTEREAKC